MGGDCTTARYPVMGHAVEALIRLHFKHHLNCSSHWIAAFTWLLSAVGHVSLIVQGIARLNNKNNNVSQIVREWIKQNGCGAIKTAFKTRQNSRIPRTAHKYRSTHTDTHTVTHTVTHSNTVRHIHTHIHIEQPLEICRLVSGCRLRWLGCLSGCPGCITFYGTTENSAASFRHSFNLLLVSNVPAA